MSLGDAHFDSLGFEKMMAEVDAGVLSGPFDSLVWSPSLGTKAWNLGVPWGPSGTYVRNIGDLFTNAEMDLGR